MENFNFKILKQDKKTRARTGIIKTRRGKIETPYFVPVATSGSLRALNCDDLAALGTQCALVNTYHLHLRPGDKIVKKLGGMHKFMNFEKPLFSDSGGFQAFSLGLAREHNIGKIGNFFPDESASTKTETGTLGKLNVNGGAKKENLTRITDEGIKFKSVYDGSWHFMDARTSMKIQSNLDSDIIMAFDECTSPLSDKDYTAIAMRRTHDWAKLSIKYHNKKQALYGIIQGGWFSDLRAESTEFIASKPFDGIAIGGSLGNSKRDMHQILEWVIPKLDERPRHLLGIGDIDDIFECVQRGIDTFDCVSPTRNARRGSLFLYPESGGRVKNKFRLHIASVKFREDKNPVDPHCTCFTCRNHSRAYLRHLYHVGELSYYRLATIHNLHFMLDLMGKIRESIKKERFLALKKKWLNN
jgi:tRNA-guanine transglycosylase